MAKPLRYTGEMIEEYLAKGYWDRKSLVDLLEENAQNYPDKEAIVDSKTRITWDGLNRLANKLALGFLDLGFKKDEAIIVQLPSSVEMLSLAMAFQKAGILTAFPALTFRQRELRHILKTMKAKGVIVPGIYRGFDFGKMVQELKEDLPELKYVWTTGESVAEGLLSLQAVKNLPLEEKYPLDYLSSTAYGPFEVSIIVFSSGSTGLPKCIEIPNAAHKLAGKGIIERARLTRNDVFGIIAPLSGGPGLQTWWAALQLGAKTVLQEHFDPEDTLKLIEKEKITFLSAVPAQIIRILREGRLDRYDLSSLKVIRTGAAALSPVVAKEAEERFKCKVVIAGGSQETYSFAHTSVEDPDQIRLNTLGKPFPGNELKIVDEEGKELPFGTVGELLVRGAATSSGYYGDLEATIKAWGSLGKEGWFRTGDLARIDEGGNLVLVGRKKEMILRGGQNIYPTEIEELLLSHPKVAEAAVIGMPDPIMGERVCAYIIPRRGEKFTFEEMVEFLKEQKLAIHKLPERMELVERFPRLAEGQKVDKFALRKDIEKKLQREGKIF
jgi:non-ribosomal peptide synthetase component E (peptide arylation enzyme)